MKGQQEEFTGSSLLRKLLGSEEQTNFQNREHLEVMKQKNRYNRQEGKGER